MSKIVKQLLGESSKPIIVRDKVVPRGLLICPHCEKEIYEMHHYHRDGLDYHSDCGGQIEFPGPTPDEAESLKQWGLDYDSKTKSWNTP